MFDVPANVSVASRSVNLLSPVKTARISPPPDADR